MRSGPLWRGRDSEHITETSSRKQSGSTVHYRIYGLDGKLEIRGEVDVASAADIAAEARRIFIDHAPATVLCRPR